MKKILKKALTVMKAHQAATMVVAALVVAGSAAVCAELFIQPKTEAPGKDVSSGIVTAENESSVVETSSEAVVSDEVSSESTVSVDTSTVNTSSADAAPTSSKEPVSSKPVSSAAAVSSKKTESTSSQAATVQPTASKTTTTSSQVTVVQMADPDTGVSWDGKSPIVYTYPDGTTGTEKRDGATYEQVPGVINTVEGTISVDSDGVHCIDCEKVIGNGTNGTCVQWLMGDVDCPNCGEHVAVRTCHTCGE